MKSNQKGRRQLIEQFGAACQKCGYNRCVRALHFHHSDGSEKKEWSKGLGRASTEEIRAHPERFTLLCANCHTEEHDAIDRANRLMALCQSCGKEFRTFRHRRADGRGKFCSRRCQHRMRGKVAEANVERRFMRHVRKTDHCWEWTAHKTNGTGVFNRRNPDGTYALTTAARVSHELFVGPIPEGMETFHDCRNPGCVRPDHLVVRRRAVDPPTSFLAGLDLAANPPRCDVGNPPKLSPDQTAEVRRIYEAGGRSQAELAEQFGISQSTISNIVRHKNGII